MATPSEYSHSQQASSNIASQTPLQALALKQNFWQKLTEYNEELRGKNDHTQIQLREVIGQETDADVTRILGDLYKADLIRIEVEVFTLPGRLRYGYKAEIWSLQRFMEEKGTHTSAEATEKAVGNRIDHSEKYNLTPVFENPVYERSERVAAREENFKSYHDKLIDMSRDEQKYQTKRVEQDMSNTIVDTRKEEIRYRIFEHIRKATIDKDLLLEEEAAGASDPCPDQLKLDALKLTELNALAESHRPHKMTKKSTVPGENGDDA